MILVWGHSGDHYRILAKQEQKHDPLFEISVDRRMVKADWGLNLNDFEQVYGRSISITFKTIEVFKGFKFCWHLLLIKLFACVFIWLGPVTVTEMPICLMTFPGNNESVEAAKNKIVQIVIYHDQSFLCQIIS